MDDDSQSATLVCPICGRALAPAERHGATVYVCPVNHGAWADNKVFNHTLETVRSYQSLTERRVAPRRSARHPEVWMENFCYRGYYIDYCPISRGVWLDWAEIRPVLEHDAKFKSHVQSAIQRRDHGKDGELSTGFMVADILLESVFWVLAAIFS